MFFKLKFLYAYYISGKLIHKQKKIPQKEIDPLT